MSVFGLLRTLFHRLLRARLEVNTAIRRQYYWVCPFKHSADGRLNVKGTRVLLELIRT